MRRDGRQISRGTRETIRMMAVQRVKEGEKPSDVIKSFGLCRTTIYLWIRAAKNGGKAALRSRRHPGPKYKLSREERQQVRKWVCGKDPRHYGFDTGLWTRQIVVELVNKKAKKKISVPTAGRLLHSLNITSQKPLRRAYERDPKAIEKWMREDYPKIKACAKRRKADIFFLDEAGIRSDAPLQRTWGKKGKTPIVRTSGQRQSINAISAVSPVGAFWYSLYTDKLNAAKFVEFLQTFLRTRRKNVFLIVDGLPSHKAKLVSRYLETLHGKLELFFLPGYAPDLNPDEFVWNHLRQKGVSKNPLKQNESLQKRVEHDLSQIKSDKSLIRSFFYAPSVEYTMI